MPAVFSSSRTSLFFPLSLDLRCLGGLIQLAQQTLVQISRRRGPLRAQESGKHSLEPVASFAPRSKLHFCWRHLPGPGGLGLGLEGLAERARRPSVKGIKEG